MMLICQRCKKEWDYNGSKTGKEKYPEYTSCPKCRANVKVINEVVV